MADLLVAIGGTGQHVALSVARLIRLSAIPKEDIEAYILDSDDTQTLSMKLKTFGGTVTDATPHLHPLRNGNVIYAPFERTTGKTVFEKLFIDENSPDSEKMLFDALFDEDSASKDLAKGMYARPSVGATVFAKSSEKEMAYLFDCVSRADKVIITGSFAGGTGAGITHQLVSILEKKFPHKRRYGVFLLPWLTLPGGEKRDVTDMAMNQNMRHGLEYFFSNTAPKLYRSTLLGIPENEPDWLRRAEVVQGKSDEYPHLLHVVAAYIIREMPKDVSTDIQGQVFAFGHDEHRESLYGLWKVGVRLRDGRVVQTDLRSLVECAYFVKILLNFLTSIEMQDKIKSALRLFSFTHREHITTSLYETIRSHLKDSKLQKDEFINQMIAQWKISSSQLDFSIQWIQNLLGPVQPNKDINSAEQNPFETLRECWTSSLEQRRGSPRQPFEVALEMEMMIRDYYLGR